MVCRCASTRIAVAVPGVALTEIFCVQEERQVGNDNCVSFNPLKLQIPTSPLRVHFVKARVKVRLYPDGTYAVFHGQRRLGRYDAAGKAIEETTDNAKQAASIRSARRSGHWMCDQNRTS
jgi:hypothetical protein